MTGQSYVFIERRSAHRAGESGTVGARSITVKQKIGIATVILAIAGFAALAQSGSIAKHRTPANAAPSVDISATGTTWTYLTTSNGGGGDPLGGEIIRRDGATWFCPSNSGCVPLGSGGAGDLETRDAKTPGPQLLTVKASARPLTRATRSDAYLRLARVIELDSPATDEVRVLNALQALGVKRYDYNLVDDYLYHQALKQGARVRWIWRPMREKDMKGASEARSWAPVPAFGLVRNDVYAKAIPERILARVAEIVEPLPDAVFLVSDYEVVKPDPFLAVSTPKLLAEHKLWIIDQWDEPGFEEAPSMQLAPARDISKLEPVAEENPVTAEVRRPQ